MAPCEVLIRLATDEDTESIEDQFNSTFLRDEPVHSYLQKYRSPYEERQKLRNHGVTMVAETIQDGSQRIVGFLMSQIARVDQSNSPKDFVLRTDYLGGNELYQMVGETDTKCNIFDRYLVEEALDMLVLCVADEFRGMGIATKLCGAALNLAEERRLKVAFMDVTSYYSALVAERIGMGCCSELAFDEYQRKRGYQLFTVKAPHTHFKRFVKCFG